MPGRSFKSVSNLVFSLSMSHPGTKRRRNIFPMYSKYRPLLPQIARKTNTRGKSTPIQTWLSRIVCFPLVQFALVGAFILQTSFDKRTRVLFYPRCLALQLWSSTKIARASVFSEPGISTMHLQKYEIILLLLYIKVQFKINLTVHGNKSCQNGLICRLR